MPALIEVQSAAAAAIELESLFCRAYREGRNAMRARYLRSILTTLRRWREPPSAPSEFRYGAFISYSRKADASLAAAIRTAIQRMARPWYRIRAVRLFQDDASLSANPALWPSIEAGLEQSEHLMILASPASAASRWVEREVQYWITNRPIENIQFVLTEPKGQPRPGSLEWRDVLEVLPPSLVTYFGTGHEDFDSPRFVDLTWVRHGDLPAYYDPRFQDCMADLAAPIRHMAKEDLRSADIRQHRRTIRMAIATGATIMLLAVLAGAAAWTALNQLECDPTAATHRDQPSVAYALPGNSGTRPADRASTRRCRVPLESWRRHPIRALPAVHPDPIQGNPQPSADG